MHLKNMNNRHLTLGLLTAIATVSCTVSEVSDPVEKDLITLTGKTYYATIEDEPDDATRTLADDQYHVLWHADDRITMFEDLPYGQEYRFAGEDNDPAGPFEPIPFEGYIGGGSDLGGKTFALYPHRKDTKINTDGVITYQFPGIQTYLPNSFGRGSNPMMAQAEGKVLRFKNVGGYLCFKLYGDNVSVSSLTLEGNGGEALTGEGQIVMTDGTPVVTMNREKSSNKVVLYCNDPVELGADADHYTLFWFVLPPVAFSKDDGGFTLTVSTSDGKVFSKSAAMDLEIERNNIKNMAPLNVVPSGSVSGLSLDGVKPHAANINYKTTYDASTRTFTVTMPTVTDFSSLVFDYEVDGDALLVDGEVIENGVTPVDASQPVSLTVRSGNKDVRYTLLARNTGLPVVRITTNGFTLEDLESYQNSLQSSDKLDHRVWLPDDEDPSQSGWSATVRIENPDGTPGMGGVYEVATQIKGRGNYTWKWDKKPYALKLASNVEVLGMPAHKRWVLLANWRDRTLLRNDAAFWLSKQSAPELPYTTRGQFVELEFNGEHRGNYYLCEQIKIDQNRVNITALNKGVGFTDLSGGYLMEIDSYWDELNKFRSAEFNLKYMFKEPDDDPMKADKTTGILYQEAYTWMENYIKEFERILKTRSTVTSGAYENYLDVDSAIMFMLLNELTGNRDFFQNGNDEVFGPHSTYLYKDKGGKLFMGPGWDFDYETFIAQSYINQNSNNSDGWRGFTKTGYYYHYLRYNPIFVQRIKDLWNEKKAAFLGLTAYINQMAGKISLSQEFDEAIWPYKTSQANRNDNHDYYENWKVVPYTTAISRMTTNFEARVTWMDTRINQLSTTNPSFKYGTPDNWPSQ